MDIEAYAEFVNEEVPSILNWGTDVAIDPPFIASYDVGYDRPTGYLYAMVRFISSAFPLPLLLTTIGNCHWHRYD